MACCGVALGITTAKKKGKKRTWKERMVCASLEENSSITHGWERVGLAKVILCLKKRSLDLHAARSPLHPQQIRGI